MMKKIILHGATNCGSSNFGDFLYGVAVYNYIKENYKDIEVGFYNPSEYFIKYIGDCKILLSKSDMLIYIPGGYFGQSHKSRFIDNAIQFVRFMPVGIKAIFKSIKIGVIGIGAGPIISPFLKYPIKMIGNKAEMISTRDNESYNALESLGLDNILELSDLILALNIHNLSDTTDQVVDICKKCEGRKLLFVHYNHSLLARDIFARQLDAFVEENPEYQLVVGSDCLLSYDDEYYIEFSKRVKKNCIQFNYDSPFELIALLERVDAVLTCKLHVGVVATMLNKPVVCFAEHPEKTKRYYRQINQPDRCVSLYDTSEEEMLGILKDKIFEKSFVPDEEIDKAKRNFDVLNELINKK